MSRSAFANLIQCMGVLRRGLGLASALACVTLISTPNTADALPADFSPPARTLGFADREGRVQWHLELREIDFGDGLKIPFRFSFNSGDETSLYGWSGFNLGAIEASAVKTSPTLYLLTFLCSKKIYFKQDASDNSKFLSNDRQWTLDVVNSSTLKVSRWDGWELRFKKGLIDSVTTDNGRTLRWERDATANDRVKRIYEPATNTTALKMVQDGLWRRQCRHRDQDQWRPLHNWHRTGVDVPDHPAGRTHTRV